MDFASLCLFHFFCCECGARCLLACLWGGGCWRARRPLSIRPSVRLPTYPSLHPAAYLYSRVDYILDTCHRSPHTPLPTLPFALVSCSFISFIFRLDQASDPWTRFYSSRYRQSLARSLPLLIALLACHVGFVSLDTREWDRKINYGCGTATGCAGS